MSGSSRPRVKLNVALVEEILSSLRSAQHRSSLSGQRRRDLTIAYERLAKERSKARGEVVQVSMQSILHILNSYATCQAWFVELLGDFE